MTDRMHPSNDQTLNALCCLEGLIGEYVLRYPGKNQVENHPEWLEEWFLERVNQDLAHPSLVETGDINTNVAIAGLLQGQASAVRKSALILSIWPHYFRGFRIPETPINLAGRLIVIDGRNSSGKTSLAEAFEWLLSGQLSRRYYSDMGDAEELENCIANQLRPDNEVTWVEAQFSVSGGETIKARRLLTKDYCKEKNAEAKSEFYVNDIKLSKQEEEAFLDEFIAGVTPVLMQHSLRTFVLSTPRERRNYFERLLRLDEIVDLIEKSVIGDKKLEDFPSPLGSVTWKIWEDFLLQISSEHRRPLRRVEQSPRKSIKGDASNGLLELARVLFELPDSKAGLQDVTRVIEFIQQQKRAKSFPLLDNLRPMKTIDPQLIDLFVKIGKGDDFAEFVKRHMQFLEADKSAKTIGAAQLVISETLERLSKIGIVIETEGSQTCPLCDSASPTLSLERIELIRSWQPIQKARQAAEDEYRESIETVKEKIEDLVSAREGLLPASPVETDWYEVMKNSSAPIQDAASTCMKALRECTGKVKPFDNACKELLRLLSSDICKHDLVKIKAVIEELDATLGAVITNAHTYLDAFKLLENTVGTQARGDLAYNLREVWLSLVNKMDDLVADMLWEQSKKKVQNDLEKIRQFLVSARDQIIESRRTTFSEGMTKIWGKLRSDRYSVFNRLYIPPPRGKGLPLEIKVKALLNDATQEKEVDALRVFSESQINILGIAAFTTRSKMLGHRWIILDDPVQSMDEEHFKTFVNQLLPELLGDDGQVIVLTHNDMFARELSYAWANKDANFFITMSIDHLRKVGCVIQEGNRRVFERLKQAEDFVDKGDLINAWIAVRKAIERFYTLVRVKFGEPGFDHYSWRNSTGEDMLKQGVSSILQKNAVDPSSISEILKMTAAAAHDKKPYGETDLHNSVKTLRGLASKLHLDC